MTSTFKHIDADEQIKDFSITSSLFAPGSVLTSIHADSNSNLTGDVQLVSGSSITLSQVGQTITINNAQTLTQFHTFAGDVSNVVTDNSVLQVDIPDTAIGINTVPVAGVDLTTTGPITLGSTRAAANVRFEPIGTIAPSNPAWESGYLTGLVHYGIAMDDGTSKTTFVDFGLNGIIDFPTIVNAPNIRTTTISTIGALAVIDLSGNGVGISGPSDPTAKLDVQSSTQGFLPPRMTAAQMNAIAATAVASGAITFGTPNPGDTITFTNLPNDGTITFVEGIDFTTIQQLTVLIDNLVDISASNSATEITLTAATLGPSMNSATVTGTGTYINLNITFSGGAGPTEGLFIYNLDTHHYYGFDGSVWQELYYFSDVPA